MPYKYDALIQTAFQMDAASNYDHHGVRTTARMKDKRTALFPRATQLHISIHFTKKACLFVGFTWAHRDVSRSTSQHQPTPELSAVGTSHKQNFFPKSLVT